MHRALVCLLALLLVPLGQASDPVAPEGSVWTVYNSVDVQVIDNYAIVDVTAEIGNRGPDPEFPFQVRLPEEAFVTGLKLVRDGDVWIGQIQDRDDARQKYEEEKGKENTAALVEKKRGTQVFAFLVNVAEFESVTATLRYEVYLKADMDVYSLPLEIPVSGFGQDLGGELNARVCHGDGVTQAWGTPAMQERDDSECQLLHYSIGGGRDLEETTEVAIHYSLDPTADEGNLQATIFNGTGYFAHRFRAPADAEQLPLDLVLVLDTSGSMGRESKMQQMQDAAVQVIAMLDADDRLEIVEFNSDTYVLWDGLQPADADNRQTADRFVRELLSGGSTNIEAAIKDGFASFPEEECEAGLPVIGEPVCPGPRSAIMVFLTDGEATTGVTGPAALRSMAKEENPGVRVFSLAFGARADRGLVSGLARDNGGTALRVASGDGAEVDLRRFMTALTTPVLEDVEIAYDGEVDAYRAGAPVLFHGSELLVVGTFDADMTKISGNVTGNASDGPRKYSFSATPQTGLDVLPRIVAYAQIQRWQLEIELEGESDATVVKIKALALEHGFVTDYTSLVLATEVDAPSSGGEADGMDYARSTTPTSSPPSAPASPPSPGGAKMDGDDGDGDGDGAGTSTPVPVWLLIAALAIALVRRRR